LLAKNLTNTTCIGSMISIVRRTTGQGLSAQEGGSTKEHWITAGILEAERSFKGIKG
jgi:hypothetical protein